MELLATVTTSGFASGINVYAVALLLGLGTRTGYLDAPELLGQPVVLAITGALFALEFVADKIPFVDSLWDTIHLVIRPIGAGLLGLVLTGELSTVGQLGAAASSAALATIAHTAKATARAAINTSPEPVTNIVTSFAEDVGVAGLLVLAAANPALAIVVVVVLVVVALVVTVTAIRLLRKAGRAARRRGADAWRRSRLAVERRRSGRGAPDDATSSWRREPSGDGRGHLGRGPSEPDTGSDERWLV